MIIWFSILGLVSKKYLKDYFDYIEILIVHNLIFCGFYLDYEV